MKEYTIEGIYKEIYTQRLHIYRNDIYQRNLNIKKKYI